MEVVIHCNIGLSSISAESHTGSPSGITGTIVLPLLELHFRKYTVFNIPSALEVYINIK